MSTHVVKCLDRPILPLDQNYGKSGDIHSEVVPSSFEARAVHCEDPWLHLVSYRLILRTRGRFEGSMTDFAEDGTLLKLIDLLAYPPRCWESLRVGEFLGHCWRFYVCKWPVHYVSRALGLGLIFWGFGRNQRWSGRTGQNLVTMICLLFAIYPASWLLVSLHSCIWLYLLILCRRGESPIGDPEEAECYSLPRHYPTFKQKQPLYLYWIITCGMERISKIYACDGRLGTMRSKGNMTLIE